eukprot:12421967-Heterocapsa_arctica.AAC.1
MSLRQGAGRIRNASARLRSVRKAPAPGAGRLPRTAGHGLELQEAGPQAHNCNGGRRGRSSDLPS